MRYWWLMVVGPLLVTVGCGPPGWEMMGPPDITGKQAMATVDAFIATNGWEMGYSSFEFSFGTNRPPLLYGLPWSRLNGRGYPALTHGGILYVALEGFHHDVIGVAYNPKTNSFPPEVLGFKPLANHWYVWTFAELDPSTKLTRRYEGQK